MAIAGKVAITPKGEWNAQTAYTKLDLVFYENASYVAIQPSTGVEPTNESYWMLMVQSAGGADLEAIINGTIQVGNAKNLDGHEAEYFAPKADLAKYLPLTGGTVDGNVTVATTGNVTRVVGLKNTVREINNLLYSGDGFYALRDMTNSKNILTSSADGTNTFNGTASGNLPLTGGLVANALQTPIIVQNTTSGSNTTFIKYRGSQFDMGSLGFAETNVPAWINNDGSAWYPLLHTGNKPTGQYTGNGSATERTISSGGIGHCIMIWNNQTQTSIILTPKGADDIPYTSARFQDGTIRLATTDASLNASGVIYYYQVL